MPTSSATTGTGRPFSDAAVVTPVGEGRFRAELDDVWAVGPKAHGGMLMVLMTRAALTRLGAETGVEPEPLAVATDFLRAPDLGPVELHTDVLKTGPVELHTDVLKTGRTVSVCAVRLLQEGRLMLTATVTAGALPTTEPVWAAPGGPPLRPGPDAIDPSPPDRPRRGLVGACEQRYEPEANPFARGETGPPRMSAWVRPRGEEPDVLFALLAGDILPPTVFNLGGSVGWAPTVQLTALLRGHPAPGWLRVDSETRSVAGTWFDEDVSVVDSAGRLVCQARQLALAPRT